MNFRKRMAGRDVAGYLLLAVSVILLCRSFTLCFSNDIWYDELFTVGMAEHSYGELLHFTAVDVHPPLYYCIVKLFSDLCKLFVPGAGTIIPAKMVSVFPYFILLLYCLWFIRKRFGAFVSGLFFFCTIAMPQLSAYTVEMRMYGWAMLFVTAAFLHGYGTVMAGAGAQEAGTFWRVDAGEMTDPVNGGKNRESKKSGRRLHAVAFVLYGLAAAYTQYFAAVAVGMVYFCVLLAFIRKDQGRIKEWFLWVAISVAAYIPWLFVLYWQISTVRDSYWILPLTWRSLGGCVKFLMKPAFMDDRLNTVLAVVFFVSYVSIWGYHAMRLFYSGREKKDRMENAGEIYEDEEKVVRFWLATAGIGVLGGLVLFGFAASILIRPIFVYRYMISAAGCFWFSFALGLDEMLCKPKMRGEEKEKNIGRQNNTDGFNSIIGNRIVNSAGAVLTVLVFIVGLCDYRAFMGEEEYKTVTMGETKTALSLISSEDMVIYNFDQVQAVTAYYLPGTVERFLWRTDGEKLIQEITSPCGRLEDAGEIKNMLKIADADGKSLWFIGSFNSRDDIVAEWREAGLDAEEKGSFLLERYWFNLYKIS